MFNGKMAISAGPRVQPSAELKVRPLTDIEGLGGFGKPKFIISDTVSDWSIAVIRQALETKF